jgi:hypothetical protein
MIMTASEKRTGIARRSFKYDDHLPERRSGDDRRGKSGQASKKNPLPDNAQKDSEKEKESKGTALKASESADASFGTDGVARAGN